MSDLPPGWEWSTLGEVADTSLGKMLDKGRESGQHQVPYLRNVNVQWGRFDLNSVLNMDIAPEQRQAYEVVQGDLLVCEGGEIGRCAVWPGSSEYIGIQKALHRVRPNVGIDVRYLRHQLEWQSRNGILTTFATGSTIKHLPQQQLRQLRIPVPPTPEQRRIVTALEDHLSHVDAAERSLDVARRRRTALSRSLREAVLFAPTEGDKTCPLGDSLERIEAGRSFGGAARRAAEGEWGIIKVSAMTWGEFREAENKVLLDPAMVDSRYEVRPGDILVSRANTKDYVGAAVLVVATRPKLLLSDKSLRLVPKSGFDPRWLVEVLSSPSQTSGSG